MSKETKICQACKREFVIASEDFAFYKKIDVPPPTWCPACRMKRRLAWYGERALYLKKDYATGKEIFSMYHPDSPYRIYEHEYWQSDAWNPMDYGRDIDWNRPFLEQFHELELAVPRPSRSILRLENSDYSNNAGDLKNSYLVFEANYVEDALYCTRIDESKDCVDCTNIVSCQLCYGCVSCLKCYRSFYAIDCEECSEVILSKNCLNCMNCFGCVNLRNKKYCIFNQQYSKEAYEEKMRSFDLSSHQRVRAYFEKAAALWVRYPVRYSHSAKSEDVSGEYIYSSQDVKQSYAVRGGQQVKYCSNLKPTVKDCYDYDSWGMNAELVYETAVCGIDISRIKVSYDIFPSCTELEYCIHCQSSSFLFGCVGLRSKKYCILNKQYEEAEYYVLVEKIKKHMEKAPYIDGRGRLFGYGEFFPLEFCPYGYNESLAYELYPLSKEEALAQGFSWRDLRERKQFAAIPATSLPDSIGNAEDSVLQEVIGCEHAGKCADNCTVAFKLIPQELAFYRKLGIPLPRLCHNCRHMERIKWRNRPTLYDRSCQCSGAQSENGVYKNTVGHAHGASRCPNRLETTYAPDRKEIVYCEACYKSEVL